MLIKETRLRIEQLCAQPSHDQVAANSASLNRFSRELGEDHEDHPRPTFNRNRCNGDVIGQKLEADRHACTGGFYRHLRLESRKHRSRKCFQHRCVTWLALVLALSVALLMCEMRVHRSLNQKWRPDADIIAFSKKPLEPPPQSNKIVNFELPLRTQGPNIVDADNKRFKLASVNWQGANDRSFVVGGLNVKHRSEIAETIKMLGFNSVRLSYTTEMVTTNPVVDSKLLSKNQDLIGKMALEVFEATTKSLTNAGIAVIISHRNTGWCYSGGLCDAGWLSDYFEPICRRKQTQEEWLKNWEKIMLPYLQNPFVIGCDLGAEAGRIPWLEWAATAEVAGNHLLRMNPDWLIIVEGANSASDLSGAGERPIVFEIPNKLVYSAHVCSARVCGSPGWGSIYGRFAQYNYASVVSTMSYNWGYLLEQDIAPLWLGELDASQSPGLGSRNYWRNLVRYLKQLDVDFAYSALNPRNSKASAPDINALVRDDYTTPIVDYRMKDMRELMSQQQDEDNVEHYLLR